jgi:hypothetical protein
MLVQNQEYAFKQVAIAHCLAFLQQEIGSLPGIVQKKCNLLSDKFSATTATKDANEGQVQLPKANRTTGTYLI